MWDLLAKSIFTYKGPYPSCERCHMANLGEPVKAIQEHQTAYDLWKCHVFVLQCSDVSGCLLDKVQVARRLSGRFTLMVSRLPLPHTMVFGFHAPYGDFAILSLGTAGSDGANARANPGRQDCPTWTKSRPVSLQRGRYSLAP